MAKPFNVETEESRFRLPPQTRQQIVELIALNQSDARSEIIIAIAERHGREIQNDRDVFAELDELRNRLDMLRIPAPTPDAALLAATTDE